MRISNKKKEWCQQPKQQGSRRSLNIFLPCRHNGHDRRDGNKCKEKTRISQECLFISEQRMKSNSIQHKDQAENIRLKCQLLTMVNHQESWEEAWCIPSENFEDTLARQISNQQLNESTATIRLSWTIKGRRLKWEIHVLRIDNSSNLTNIRTELRPLGFLVERECEEDQGYQLEMHTGEREKKTWGGGVLLERGVGCCKRVSLVASFVTRSHASSGTGKD